MNDFDDFVDKHDYLILQLISRLSELFNPHYTEHHVYPLPWPRHIIHEPFIGPECFRDDFRSQLTEPTL